MTGLATVIDGAVSDGITLAVNIAGDFTSVIAVVVGLAIFGVAFAVVGAFMFNR